MVEGLCKGNDPGEKWNIFSPEPVWITLSIPSLMVTENDLADLC